MPSGSHGRSPFGSGSLSSRSSGSSYSAYKRKRTYYNGNRVYIFGSRSYYVNSGKKGVVKLFSVLAWIMFFVALFTGIGILGASNEIDGVKENYYYYQNMITEAYKNPSTYIVEAKVIGIQPDEDSDNYYLIYEIPYTKYYITHKLEGISYPVYTLQQANIIKSGIYIDVAVDNDEIDEDTDSVPVDFKDFKLEQIPAYTNALSSRKNMIIISCTSLGLFVGSLVCYIVIFKKNLVEIQNESIETVADTSTPKEEIPSVWKCPYCGGINSRDDNKCSNCGASKK